MENLEKKAILLLEDGTVMHGIAAGLVGTTTGEICFNTGMTGYQEIFTDPSYFGQIMTTTTTHIGNYGTALDEVESENVNISGLVCKKFSDVFSRDAADTSLQDYFENNVCISEIVSSRRLRYDEVQQFYHLGKSKMNFCKCNLINIYYI